MKAWIYKGSYIDSIEDILKFYPDAIGFVYEIELSNGRRYIGKKNLFSTRKVKLGKKELAKLTDKRLKKYKMVTKESDWLSYIGSSKPLKEDLTNGFTIMSREILIFAESPRELTYLETQQLFCRKVLELGSKYYNESILGKFFKNVRNGK